MAPLKHPTAARQSLLCSLSHHNRCKLLTRCECACHQTYCVGVAGLLAQLAWLAYELWWSEEALTYGDAYSMAGEVGVPPPALNEVTVALIASARAPEWDRGLFLTAVRSALPSGGVTDRSEPRPLRGWKEAVAPALSGLRGELGQPPGPGATGLSLQFAKDRLLLSPPGGSPLEPTACAQALTGGEPPATAFGPQSGI